MSFRDLTLYIFWPYSLKKYIDMLSEIKAKPKKTITNTKNNNNKKCYLEAIKCFLKYFRLILLLPSEIFLNFLQPPGCLCFQAKGSQLHLLQTLSLPFWVLFNSFLDLDCPYEHYFILFFSVILFPFLL